MHGVFLVVLKSTGALESFCLDEGEDREIQAEFFFVTS